MLIDFLRHGETVLPGHLLGHTDAALADAGWVQFERQTERRSFDAVVASPLKRARLAAEAVAAERGVPFCADADWSELDFGAWDGRALADLNADEATAAALAAIYTSADAAGAPEGESWRDLERRVIRAIDRLMAFGADSRVLVSSHAGPMRAALAVACAMPFEALWAFRIDYGTRLTLRVGRGDGGALWGEVIEIVQP